MIDRLLEFLTGGRGPTTESGADELELSVAALLIEAAHMDSKFDAAERATIERLLAKKFGLGPQAVQSVCERAESVGSAFNPVFPLHLSNLPQHERLGAH